MKRLRVLPLEWFAVIEVYSILCLIYSPAPWVTAGPPVVFVSSSLGVFLALTASANALMGRIRFRTHLAFASLVGLSTLAMGIWYLAPGATARIPFLVLGGLLTLATLFVRLPEHEAVAAMTQPGTETPLEEIPHEEEEEPRRAA